MRYKAPGFLNDRWFNIEALLTEADAGRTAVTLNGGTIGRGPGGKGMVRKAVGAFRTAIEEQTQAG